jgi:Sodium:sulfate symporter transmembrane region
MMRQAAGSTGVVCVNAPSCLRSRSNGPLLATSKSSMFNGVIRMPRLSSKPLVAKRIVKVEANASVALAASSVAPTPPAGFQWGADMKSLSISVGVAVLIWFLPPPAGVALQAWHLLGIFLGTIVGIITQPLPLGAVAMIGLGAAMVTKTLTFAAAFSAFASEIP